MIDVWCVSDHLIFGSTSTRFGRSITRSESSMQSSSGVIRVTSEFSLVKGMSPRQLFDEVVNICFL